MKFKKMLGKLEELLDADTRERLKHRDEMKTLLRKMKQKERSLAEKALCEFDRDRLERLRKEIDMVHAQREKGVKALRKMKDKKSSGG